MKYHNLAIINYLRRSFFQQKFIWFFTIVQPKKAYLDFPFLALSFK